MYRWYLGLKFMLSYFTILPVRFKPQDDLSHPQVLGAMLFWLPLGGIILGGLSLLLFLLLHTLGWVGAVAAALGYMMLYGFLHTEAIMDVADALYAKHAGIDPFAVIKESTVGAMGVLWAVAVMLLKVTAIVFLLTHEAYGLYLSTLIISRLGLQGLFVTQSFRSSFINRMQEGFGKNCFAASLLLFSTTSLLLLGWHFLMLLLVGAVITYLIATTIAGRLGFMNGDVLGTTLEGTETLLMLLGAVLWL